MSTWDIDLPYGEDRQNAFVKRLCEMGSRVEHKSDRKFATTGNLAIEFEARSPDGTIRLSGVSLDSDSFAFEYLPNRWLVVPTEVARLKAAEASRLVWGGDGNRSHLALVKPTVFFT